MKVLDTSLDCPVRINPLTSQPGLQEAGSELSPKGAVTGGEQTGVTVPQQLNAMMGKADQQELEEDSGKLLRQFRNWLSR